MNVADRARKRAHSKCYISVEAETAIIASSNSESDTEDVRSRKVYMTPLARAKGKTFFNSVLSAVTRPVHTARRAGQRTKNREQRFPTRRHGHGIQYAIELTS